MHILSNFKFILSAFVVANLLPSYSFANECESALKFNEQIITQNDAMMYSYLNSITKENYDNRKIESSGQVMDFFKGGFSEFQSKRRSFNQIYSAELSQNIDRRMYLRALSPEGVTAFYDCMELKYRSPFQVRVSLDDSRNGHVVVTVKNNLVGEHNTMFYTFEGDPEGKRRTLLAGASETLLFTISPSKGGSIILNAQDEAGRSLYDGEPIYFAPIVNYRRIEETVPVRAWGHCYAGAHNSYAGNRETANAYLVAPEGFHFKIDSAIIERSEKPRNYRYSLRREPTWKWEYTPKNSESPTAMTGIPSGCLGQDDDTHGGKNYLWRATAYKVKLEKVE